MKSLITKHQLFQLKKIVDYQIVIIAVTVSLALLYYVDFITSVGISAWDRTFCTAMLAGISIEKRVSNLYMLYLVIAPVTFFLALSVFSALLSKREEYKQGFFRINAVLLFAVIAGYLSRYEGSVAVIAGYLSRYESSVISPNALLCVSFVYQALMAAMLLLDKKSVVKAKDIVFLYIVFAIASITLNTLLQQGLAGSLIITSCAYIAFWGYVFASNKGEEFFCQLEKFMCLTMWIPFIICFSLECLYFLNEKGIQIQNYRGIICWVSIVCCGIAIGSVIVFHKRWQSFYSAGYLGAIISMGCMEYILHAYQYVWGYSNYANAYEAGNASVAVDTVINGKLPVIDYFSAHALQDVWTRILYSVIHSDVKGILADPYGGISKVLSLVVIFIVLKQIFDAEWAILYVCFFPYIVAGIKWGSLCFLTLLLLLKLIKKHNVKSCLLFWTGLLISAFYIYDEGISLGIACIISILILNACKRDWITIKRLIVSGITVAGIVALAYFVYCGLTGLDAVLRLKEWMSVSVSSNSTWATSYFGDISTLEFLISYFIAPISAAAILIIAIYDSAYIRTNPVITGLMMTFSLAQLLYVPRTIIWHNLEVSQGKNGRLLNFWPWTVSMLAIYICVRRKKNIEKKFFIWLSVFGAWILMEGALITGNLPTRDSILYTGAFNASRDFNLSSDMSSIWGKERIIYDEDTSVFIKKFRDVFDLLMDDSETFLDFANMTSLYALTDRERPFYVGQSPSLLTDLYSQRCYLDELQDYKAPLAIISTANEEYTQQMAGIPHNIRYYTVAEYIYQNYRPILDIGDFAIWCEKERYEEYSHKLKTSSLLKEGNALIDYGYDIVEAEDNADQEQFQYRTINQYQIGMLAYIWANYDQYDAINNHKLADADFISSNKYKLPGSQSIQKEKGNYIAFTCNNSEHAFITVMLNDSRQPGVKFEYNLDILPGSSQYLIRASQDYFWTAFNIDTIQFYSDSEFEVSDVMILEGD